jgi:uncharacterized protein YegL
MTDPGYRHLIFIIDHSKSMENIRDGMVSGFQELISKQRREPLRTTVSLWQFDDVIECCYSFASFDDVAEYELYPCGMTALHDAIGKVVTSEGEKLALLPEGQRPGQVVVTVISDGRENASTEYDGTRVAAMLKHQQEAYGWGVLYLGTNQDAIAEGAKIGVGQDRSLSYDSTSRGTQSALRSVSSVMSAAVASSMANVSVSYAFSDEDRAAAKKAE